MNTNNYTATSDSPITNSASQALANVISNPVSDVLRNANSWARDVQTTAGMAVKLTMSEIGVARSIIVRGAYSDVLGSNDYRVKTGNFKSEESSASSQPFDRYDSNKDFYFRCGDYFLPLSVKFTLRAQKNLVESQLIDGPYIVERVSKSPKTIDVTIRLQRAVSEDPTPLHIVNNENLYNPVPDISAMINDLFESQDVFQVENPILNREHGITHVVMREYEIIPGEGSTIMTLIMSLMQIDMKANIINNEGNDRQEGEILQDNGLLA